MATTIPKDGLPGFNIYAFIKTYQGTIWNGSSLVPYVLANWATYAVAMSDTTGAGNYVVPIPNSLPAGQYRISYYQLSNAGDTPASTDTPYDDTESFGWDGSEPAVTAVMSNLGTVNVGGYSAGQDPGTLVLAAEVEPGVNVKQAHQITAARAAGAIVESPDHTTTTIQAAGNPQVPRMQSNNTATTRSVTILP